MVKIMKNNFLLNPLMSLLNKTMITREKNRMAALVRALDAVHKKIVCDIKKKEAKKA